MILKHFELLNIFMKNDNKDEYRKLIERKEYNGYSYVVYKKERKKYIKVKKDNIYVFVAIASLKHIQNGAGFMSLFGIHNKNTRTPITITDIEFPLKMTKLKDFQNLPSPNKIQSTSKDKLEIIDDPNHKFYHDCYRNMLKQPYKYWLLLKTYKNGLEYYKIINKYIKTQTFDISRLLELLSFSYSDSNQSRCFHTFPFFYELYYESPKVLELLKHRKYKLNMEYKKFCEILEEKYFRVWNQNKNISTQQTEGIDTICKEILEKYVKKLGILYANKISTSVNIEDVTLYRGLITEQELIYKINSVYEFDTQQSVTIDEKVAQRFAIQPNEKEVCRYLFEIKINENIQIVYANNTYEKELLLNKYTRFKVTDIKKDELITTICLYCDNNLNL